MISKCTFAILAALVFFLGYFSTKAARSGNVLNQIAPTPEMVARFIVASSRELPVVLVRIARCESGGLVGRQFEDNGSVRRGQYSAQDVGRFQINLRYHKRTADKMGIDLLTEEGNTMFAIWLYGQEGTAPWKASEKCWSKDDYSPTDSLENTSGRPLGPMDAYLPYHVVNV